MTTTTIKMNKTDLMRHYCNHSDRDVRYLANCIITGGSNVARKLKALYHLEMSGADIRTGNLWGQIRINGEQHEFGRLDTI
jgi:hypothetical protein